MQYLVLMHIQFCEISVTCPRLCSEPHEHLVSAFAESFIQAFCPLNSQLSITNPLQTGTVKQYCLI
jgi:hypothetical protein